MPNLSDLPLKFQSLQNRIAQAAQACGRAPQAIELLAVSKGQPPEAIEAAYALGQRAFGENYVQEALEKMKALKALSDIQWYFIGHLQSNKARWVAEHFDWVLSVDRLKIGKKLNALRPKTRPPLRIGLEVNLCGEARKSGIVLPEVPELAEALAQCPHLEVRGLMAIPQADLPEPDLKKTFLKLNECFQTCKQRYPQWDCLSIGMSSDLESAIACGSTQVRVGTALFGPRKPNNNPPEP